jgi:hypothetical protein
MAERCSQAAISAMSPAGRRLREVRSEKDLHRYHDGPSPLQWLCDLPPRHLRLVRQGGKGVGHVGRARGMSHLP